MLNLASGFAYGSKVAWFTLSIAGELIKPTPAPEIDCSSRYVRIYTEEETGLLYAITDRGDIRPALPVHDPHALALDGVPVRTTDPNALSQMRREVALRAEPLTTAHLLVGCSNSRSHNGNSHPPHHRTSAVPVPAHD